MRLYDGIVLACTIIGGSAILAAAGLVAIGLVALIKQAGMVRELRGEMTRRGLLSRGSRTREVGPKS